MVAWLCRTPREVPATTEGDNQREHARRDGGYR
jgi:hypothetical protein